MTFRALALLTLAAGVATLLAALALIGVAPGVPAEARHLRELKRRVTAPASVEPITLDEVRALPHDPPLARRAALEARGVSMEGWNQRLLLAGDGDVHLEMTSAPRRPGGPDTAYVTAEVTPAWRAHGGWSYDRLVEAFRPNTGSPTPWDGGPRRVRVSGWLLYDYQYDQLPSPWLLKHRAPRVSGWEIHPVTRIEVWDEARRAWSELAP